MKFSTAAKIVGTSGTFVLAMQVFILMTSLKHKVTLVYITNDTNNKMVSSARQDSRPKTLFPVFQLKDVDPDWTNEVSVKTSDGKQRFLTIGLVTARRPEDVMYIYDTLESLIINLNKEDKSEITIIVMLADNDESWNANVTENITRKYSNEITEGTVQVLKGLKGMYPKLANLSHGRKGDPPLKVTWKAKQNIDFSLLWMYVYEKNSSKYFLHLEDDVVTVENYVSSIKNQINNLRRPWTCLEFSELGMIAKLFYTKDLEKLAKIVTLFYEERPADFTYLHFNNLMFQNGRIIMKPTLFQHKGVISSLSIKKMWGFHDRYFQIRKEYKGDNPEATLQTSMVSNPNLSIENAYKKEPGFFWTKKSPQKNDFIQIIFKDPQLVKRIVVKTGSENVPKDILHSAVLEISQSHLRKKKEKQSNKTCGLFQSIGEFTKGLIDINILSMVDSLAPIKCFQIRVLTSQKNWLVVSEIAVFLWK